MKCLVKEAAIHCFKSKNQNASGSLFSFSNVVGLEWIWIKTKHKVHWLVVYDFITPVYLLLWKCHCGSCGRSDSEMIYGSFFCQWFMRSSPNNDPAEKQNIRKFQGDLLYHKHKYEQAFVMYQESRQRLPPNNTVLDRELLESMAMCLLKLGKFNEALTLVKETIVR